jgi:hypothetical protein
VCLIVLAWVLCLFHSCKGGWKGEDLVHLASLMELLLCLHIRRYARFLTWVTTVHHNVCSSSRRDCLLGYVSISKRDSDWVLLVAPGTNYCFHDQGFTDWLWWGSLTDSPLWKGTSTKGKIVLLLEEEEREKENKGQVKSHKKSSWSQLHAWVWLSPNYTVCYLAKSNSLRVKNTGSGAGLPTVCPDSIIC